MADRPNDPLRRPLDVELLRRSLVAPGILADLDHVESIDSTNAALQREAGEPDFARRRPHLSLLVAEEQTGGRGRMARGWSSPPHTSLSASLVLRPRLEADAMPWISLVAGLALVEALVEEHGVPARLKWPNDVLVDGRKICGILAALAPGTAAAGAASGSSGSSGPAVPTVILGTGINVLQEEDQLPVEGSTSLMLERRRAGAAADVGLLPGDDPARADLRADLLIQFLARFVGHLTTLESCRRGEVRDSPVGRAVVEAMETVGRRVRIELPDGSARRGEAVGVADDGALEVVVDAERSSAEEPWREHAARRTSFNAGDVVHLRPAEEPPGAAG